MKAVFQDAEKKRETKRKVLPQKLENGKCKKKSFKGTTYAEKIKRKKCKQSLCVDSSSEDVNVNRKELSDDDKLDNMDTLDALKNGVCSVCGEFGRNEELCFAV
jgi:hypothetical protein